MSIRDALPALPLPGPFAGVVTDMDGLLVHTERHWLEAKLILYARYDAELTEADQRAVFGAAELPSAEYFATRLGVPPEGVLALRDEYLDIVAALFASGVELMDGALELIERLAEAGPLGLASNTRRPMVESVLAGTPFGHRFDVIVSGDEARSPSRPRGSTCWPARAWASNRPGQWRSRIYRPACGQPRPPASPASGCPATRATR